ncbi:MAG TPA: FAD:protein FMN transferase [Ktedonobacterales bacterium]
MRQTQIIMGMPITVEIPGPDGEASEAADALEAVFAYLRQVDETFSTYKESSEISRINRGELGLSDSSEDVRTVFALSQQTREETGGYFAIWRDGHCDPSGLVKGWAIHNAEALLQERGYRDYYIDAGGDIALGGLKDGRAWRVGIRNPFNRAEIVKALTVTNLGVATSGTAIRGQHIYDPHQPGILASDIVSLTVIGPNVYEADRFATAGFAMGRRGISFIELLPGFEGYQIDTHGMATYTSGFERYIVAYAERN